MTAERGWKIYCETHNESIDNEDVKKIFIRLCEWTQILDQHPKTWPVIESGIHFDEKMYSNK